MTTIQSAKVKVTDLHSITLRITLAEAYAKGDLFSIVCYDSHLLRICAKERYRPRKTQHMRSIEMTIESMYALLPDDYTALLLHNNEPMATVTLSIDAHLNVSRIAHAPLTQGELHHFIASYLEQADTTAWKALCHTPGHLALKLRAVECQRLHRLNALRVSRSLGFIRNTLNHVVTPDSESGMDDHIKWFAYLTQHDGTVPRHKDMRDLTASPTSSYSLEDAASYMLADDTVTIYSHPETMLCGEGRRLAEILEKSLRSNATTHAILVCGNTVTAMLREAFPSLMTLFPMQGRIDCAPYSINDFIHDIEKRLSVSVTRLSTCATKALHGSLSRRMEQGTLPTLDHRLAVRYTDECLMANYITRMTAHDKPDSDISDFELGNIMGQDLALDFFDISAPSSADTCLASLDSMTGLDGIKKALHDMAALTRLQHLRQQHGLTTTRLSPPHFIFTGNPGTGKTTVAKMTGKILHSLGLLSKGDVVVADRQSLVGRYIGETEHLMQQTLQRAAGNVLFIDEAYALCDNADDRKDYGNRIVECLLTALSSEHCDMTVIIAGYEEETERLLDSNPGLRGRFTHHIRFEDFTPQQLNDIATQHAKALGMTLDSSAATALAATTTATRHQAHRHFANARWAIQLVDCAVRHAAMRITSLTTLDSLSLSTLTADDIRQALHDMPDVRQLDDRHGTCTKTIGFKTA